MMRYRHSALGVLLIGILAFDVTGAHSAEPAGWGVGDVFLAVGDGTYHVYDRAGTFKQALADERGGYTCDCGFNPTLDKLYTVNYTHTKVVVYEDEAGHGIVETIDPAQYSPDGHSGAIVFDAAGGFFVGHPDGNALVQQYNDAGMLEATFDVPVEGRRGANWLDLAADQQTLFDTPEGRRIQRYDTGSSTALAAFAELPGEGHAEAVRLLPPGDGRGGLLVADGVDVKRLDGSGEIVQQYDAPDRDAWFALNLDPDGRSFWATDHESDQVYRFDLDTGLIHQTFTAGPGNTVFGVCVKGELTAAVPQAQAALPTAYALLPNRPNPFNPSTQITFHLPQAGAVRLEVYNLLGQQVSTLVQGERQAGTHAVEWNGRDAHGRDVSSGVYFYRFAAGGQVETRSMLLLK